MALEYLGTGNDDGVTLGRDTSDLISFYGVTPIAQQSGSAMATLTATIATADSGVMFATATGINALIAQVQALRELVVDLGLHAGS